jgi:asparagine synthase (glutamine-hydrolysing)
MCGIAGAWGKIGADFAAMMAALNHRGPDDRGCFADERVSFAMTRLAIQDLSAAGHQPMSDVRQQVWIVFNGEVYNFREERAALEAKGYSFHSRSDTEVALQLYLAYGDDFLLRLRGIFALAIYDKRSGPGRERLVLARDHFGIKPLLYAEVPGGLIFASEVKALLASGVVLSELDRLSLWQLLIHGAVRQPRTILSGVRMLPPAHRMIMDWSGRRLERYWSLGVGRIPELAREPYHAVVDIISQLMRDTVGTQLVADAPLGAFLSGGVDSSLLVAFAQQRIGTIQTFSVGYSAEHSALDETDDAAKVAAHLGTHHVRVEVGGNDVRDSISDLAAALDQPSVDGANSYFVARAAARSLKVAISGTGGDEMFAGYPWFQEMYDFATSQNSPAKPRWIRAIFRQRSKVGCDDFRAAFHMQYRIFDRPLASTMMARELIDWDQAQTAALDLAASDELADAGVIERTSGLVLRGYTQNQLLRDIDATAMAHSLEVRVPFLDPVVADYALSLPADAKLYPRRDDAPSGSYLESGVKRVLLDVAKPMLPSDFGMRTKRGFTMPIASWLRGSLREILNDCLSPRSVLKRGWFDPHAVAALLQRFEAGEEGWPRPWLLMMAELWARNVLDRAGYPLSRAAFRTVQGSDRSWRLKQ